MADLADRTSIVDQDENIELEALRALQYEGTRAEIALGFKERGNEMVAQKRWKDAKEFYSKGIAALKQPRQDGEEKHIREGGAENVEKEKEKERKVEEACHVNRALCNLELRTSFQSHINSDQRRLRLRFYAENYRSTLHDTAHTLSLSPSNIKGHYRSALALLALNRHAESLDIVSRALALTSPILKSTNISARPSPEHTSFLALRSRILASQTTFNAAAQKRLGREERAKKERVVLNAALHARGVRVRMTDKPPELEDAEIRLKPDPLSPASELHFPLLLLYPIHAQSDFLKSVGETSTIADICATVLAEPMEWDKEGEY
ncbi:MAG: hypothetical protein Q9201_000344, partial [Fulgogasparrea decipioides]